MLEKPGLDFAALISWTILFSMIGLELNGEDESNDGVPEAG